MKDKTVYEVLRIINSKPLFVGDHYERLKNTILSSEDKYFDLSKQEFVDCIKNKIQEDNILNANLKIEIILSEDNEKFNSLTISQFPHYYPSAEEYENGVDLSLYKYERKNPDSKIWNQSLRERVDKEIKNRKVFELLYYDNNDSVLEGTRSNFFLLKDKNLFSAPIDRVLPGITRKHIVILAEKLGFKLIEDEISVSELPSFQAAFISGTSPKILPIRKIDSFNYNVNNIYLRLLMTEFENVICENLASQSDA